MNSSGAVAELKNHFHGFYIVLMIVILFAAVFPVSATSFAKSTEISACNALDPINQCWTHYTGYFIPCDGPSCGIGISLGVQEDYKHISCSILDVLPGSPAEKAGLKPGMQIESIDDHLMNVDITYPVANAWSPLTQPHQISKWFCGKSGTFITLKIKTKDRSNIFRVERAAISTNESIETCLKSSDKASGYNLSTLSKRLQLFGNAEYLFFHDPIKGFQLYFKAKGLQSKALSPTEQINFLCRFGQMSLLDLKAEGSGSPTAKPEFYANLVEQIEHLCLKQDCLSNQYLFALRHNIRDLATLFYSLSFYEYSAQLLNASQALNENIPDIQQLFLLDELLKRIPNVTANPEADRLLTKISRILEYEPGNDVNAAQISASAKNLVRQYGEANALQQIEPIFRKRIALLSKLPPSEAWRKSSFALELARLYAIQKKFSEANKLYCEYFELSRRFPDKTTPKYIISEYKLFLEVNGKSTDDNEYIKEFAPSK